MRTWVWTAAAAVGGYLVYSGWFASEDADDPAAPPPALEIPGETPPAGDRAPRDPTISTGAESLPRPAIDLDKMASATATVPPRDEEAWRLEDEWRKAQRSGDAQGAAELGDLLLRDHADTDPARWVSYDRGRKELQLYRQLGRNKAGLAHAAKAWRLLTPVLFLRESRPGEKKTLRRTLDKLARDILFQARHVEGVDRLYSPKRGESLSVLCRKRFASWGANVSPGFVVEINGLRSARDLRAGEPIKVPLGEPEIIIAKGEYRLYFLLQGCYVRDFAVGLGREGSTPETSFVIQEKIKNPDWHPRAGVVIRYGDPRNILGTRWLAFSSSAEFRGFGIHGTSDPASIGKDASSGCVRMLRADVERVFEWTPRGTKVRIVR